MLMQWILQLLLRMWKLLLPLLVVLKVAVQG
jgi:hypothetical protein